MSNVSMYVEKKNVRNSRPCRERLISD